MKWIHLRQKWLNLYFFRFVLTSGFPTFNILSILANFFASRFSDLFTFINLTFPNIHTICLFLPFAFSYLKCKPGLTLISCNTAPSYLTVCYAQNTPKPIHCLRALAIFFLLEWVGQVIFWSNFWPRGLRAGWAVIVCFPIFGNHFWLSRRMALREAINKLWVAKAASITQVSGAKEKCS